MKKICAAVCTLAASIPALAHPGHGMPGTVHWHATDVAGLVVVAVGALLAIWLARDE